VGAGLLFKSQQVSASGALTLGPNNASMIYLVQVPAPALNLTLTLPPAATATSRFLVIRRLDARGTVFVKASGNETLEGRGRDPRDPLPLLGRSDYVTVVSDGAGWFVFSDGQ